MKCKAFHSEGRYPKVLPGGRFVRGTWVLPKGKYPLFLNWSLLRWGCWELNPDRNLFLFSITRRLNSAKLYHNPFEGAFFSILFLS